MRNPPEEAQRLSTKVPLVWRKSSYSGSSGGECVEVATLPDGGNGLRDSKNPDTTALFFPIGEWQAFLTSVQDSEL